MNNVQLMKTGLSLFFFHPAAPCTPKPVTKVSKTLEWVWDEVQDAAAGERNWWKSGSSSGTAFCSWKLLQSMIMTILNTCTSADSQSLLLVLFLFKWHLHFLHYFLP